MNRIVREGLIEKMAFEQILKEERKLALMLWAEEHSRQREQSVHRWEHICCIMAQGTHNEGNYTLFHRQNPGLLILVSE